MARQEFEIHQFEGKGKHFKAGVSGKNFPTKLGVL